MAAVIIDKNTNSVSEKEKNLSNFKNTGKHIDKVATINIPLSLVLLLEYIAAIYANGNEYAILYKVEKEKDTLNYNIIPNDYHIPKQIVSGALIDIEEEDPYASLGYNGIVHRHPDNVKSFSSTDDTTLNSLFLTSFIYLFQESIPFLQRVKQDACINLEFDEVGKVQIKAVCNVVDDVGNYMCQIINGRVVPTESVVSGFVKNFNAEEGIFATFLNNNVTERVYTAPNISNVFNSGRYDHLYGGNKTIQRHPNNRPNTNHRNVNMTRRDTINNLRIQELMDLEFEEMLASGNEFNYPTSIPGFEDGTEGFETVNQRVAGVDISNEFNSAKIRLKR